MTLVSAEKLAILWKDIAKLSSTLRPRHMILSWVIFGRCHYFSGVKIIIRGDVTMWLALQFYLLADVIISWQNWNLHYMRKSRLYVYLWFLVYVDCTKNISYVLHKFFCFMYFLHSYSVWCRTFSENWTTIGPRTTLLELFVT
jgi:hypothetical protein